MISSMCICQQESSFVPYITYKNETVFSAFEGTVIARCTRCGMMKVFPAKTNKSFDPQQSRAQFYEDNTQRFTDIFRPIIEMVKKYKPRGTILDVGCSSGILLSLFKDNGYEVQGLEPNKSAYLMARKKLGNDIFNTTLGTFVKSNKARFDVMVYNHVLEHIDDPVAELTLAHKMMKPGGLLIVGVPNERNVIRFIRGKKWELLMPNEHVWQFSDKHLTDLLTRLGFKTLELHFADDYRIEYPFIKQLYFRVLIGLNKLFRTGEVLLLAAQKS